MNVPVLELRAVHRTHGRGETAVHALRGVSMTMRSGELLAVMGPSGSGKSTLLNLAGGLDAPSAGEALMGGVSLSGLSRRQLAALRRRAIGYVFNGYRPRSGCRIAAWFQTAPTPIRVPTR